MKARYMIEDPQKIVCTMKITMPMPEWTELRDQLDDKWPSSDLSSTITSLLIDAKQVFYSDLGD